MAHPINPGGRIFDSTENLYLCAMNNQGLLALAQLILPSEILTNFEVVRVEEEASLIRIYLDESVKAEYKENPEIESKGFCEAVTIRDFPIRDKGIDLIVRRRKWLKEPATPRGLRLFPDFVIAYPKNLHQRVWRFSDVLPSAWFGCKPPCS